MVYKPKNRKMLALGPYILYGRLAPIRCHRLLQFDSTMYDLDLKVKVKFVITNVFLRCGFLLQFITFYMSIFFQKGATVYCNVNFKTISEIVLLALLYNLTEREDSD